ncbi:ECF transporter S component [Clostridium gasigenes]|uniref:Energy-coupling factor transport system substrate-specific component n=1 Tax=Clostridium gasigenes TaxID=94869 RepID=A0A1H0TY49_9CLOT|nr:ECF transporter S component [Clostridium gasigenes]MBB6624318.1 ECF transporter S component [Clostridium gasigenes]MBU3089227.1 ECF transporter S component [Clostridium gasigenes]SDP58695.1 energy-coupling factor transport system substrate-specific component [Clostridium gasigenes]
MNENKTFNVTLMAMCVGFNIIGAFLALTLKLPVYLDTIGTFLSAFLLGPIAGVITGGVSSLINGITFDPISLYFMPVQLISGFMAGMLFKKGLFKGKLIPIGMIIVTVTSSIVASIIAAYVFGGITSSGSSFIVMYLKEAGVNIITSVFSTQILTDLLDKAVVISLVIYLIKIIPVNLKRKHFSEDVLGDENGKI